MCRSSCGELSAAPQQEMLVLAAEYLRSCEGFQTDLPVKCQDAGPGCLLP